MEIMPAINWYNFDVAIMFEDIYGKPIGVTAIILPRCVYSGQPFFTLCVSTISIVTFDGNLFLSNRKIYDGKAVVCRFSALFLYFVMGLGDLLRIKCLMVNWSCLFIYCVF